MQDWSQLALPELALCVGLGFVGLSLVSVAIGFAAERLLQERRIFDVPLKRGQYRHELVGNLVFLTVAVPSVTLVLHFELAHFASDSLLSGLLTFGALYLAFQFYYYWLHRALHTRPLIRFHAWHHVSQVTTPLSGQSMSAVEALAWMVGYAGLPVLMSQLVPISAAGWAAYLAYNVFGNIVGHANVEPMSPKLIQRWTSLGTNAWVFHALHHGRWTGHYSFGTAMMDRLHGTEWSDWPALQARIVGGEPLTSLRER